MFSQGFFLTKLNPEEQACAINFAMGLEQSGFRDDWMADLIKSLNESPSTNTKILMDFWQKVTPRLYLEIMSKKEAFMKNEETTNGAVFNGQNGEAATIGVRTNLSKEETKTRLAKMMDDNIAKREAHGIEGYNPDYITLTNALRYLD